MARDGSGNYSLPAGNPVVTGTTISSTWANATMPDVGTALTNSIAKDGQTTPTANLPMGGNRHTGVSDGNLGTQYASINQVQNGSLNKVGSVANATDAYTGSIAPAIAAYTDGLLVTLTPSVTNTTVAPTLALNGLTVKPIQKEGGVACAIGDIVLNVPVLLQYTTQSGGYFMLLNPQVITSARLTTIADTKLSSNIPLKNAANAFVPVSGISISVVAPANTLGISVTGSSTTSQSFGMSINAGTNTSDYGLSVTNLLGTLNHLQVRGDGALFVGNATDNAPSFFFGTGTVTFGGGIAGAGLATFSNASVTSSLNGSVLLSHSTNPVLGMTSTGQPANGKVWDLVVSGATFQMRVGDDTGGANKAWITGTRSANVVTNVTFGNVTDKPAVQFYDESGTAQDVGFRGLPLNIQTVNYTCVMADRGKALTSYAGGGITFTIPSNASVPYPLGTTLTFTTSSGAGACSIGITSDTLTFAANGTTGTRTLASSGLATALKVFATQWVISGAGLS